jgi:hypothetical protein
MITASDQLEGDATSLLGKMGIAFQLLTNLYWLSVT